MARAGPLTQQQGPAMERIAIITPQGLADVLALARQNRHALYAAQPQRAGPAPPDPELCFELAGRLDADGREVQPLDEAQLQAVVQSVAAARPVAVAVCGLFAPLNPAHELHIAAAMQAALPGIPVRMSHAFAARADSGGGEYERFAATVAAARSALGAPGAGPAVPTVAQVAQVAQVGATGRARSPAPRPNRRAR